MCRSSYRHMFFKIGVIKNFAIFTGKHLCWSLFLIKFQTWRQATLLKRDSNTCVFLCTLRNFQEHLFHKKIIWMTASGSADGLRNNCFENLQEITMITSWRKANFVLGKLRIFSECIFFRVPMVEVYLFLEVCCWPFSTS